jgi:flagellar protein FlbT
MHISLRAGEKIYINGAVLSPDRKVSIEILNDATFLLEAHVMKVNDATTPLRQLYFIIQIMLINPNDTDAALEMFAEAISKTIEVSVNTVLLAGLRSVKDLVEANRIFEALKMIRSMFAIEAEILDRYQNESFIQAV